ncbi:preprotein translocase subunit SecG [Acidithiobacillus sp.]|jgi:preprotein translocase subunit SecG|uniref:preprotein translocase subunit SecG n=1 Tax=Acidithiobacillus sp. TaxID=1872118 RepID=UPI0025C42920|nr:preprotein translocase subunit SecG [Acidithiobacillus sp.]MCK9189502.1 preprotein translocase subunit SecG [Acidithiobacillus sp.]MCK9359221.1 preprotein translocase subunit SecG [Acidithiobacillus sp.]
MYTALLVFQVIICIVLVGLILIQKGQGADIGAVFGGGGSQTVFGARGAGNFLSHTTAVIGAVFFLNSLGLAYLSDHSSSTVSGIALPSKVPVTTAVPVVAAPTQSVAATVGPATGAVPSASAGKTPVKP